MLTFDTGFLPLAEALSGFLSFLCDKGGKSYIATVLLETSVRHPFSRGDTISKETKGNNCLAIPIPMKVVNVQLFQQIAGKRFFILYSLINAKLIQGSRNSTVGMSRTVVISHSVFCPYTFILMH